MFTAIIIGRPPINAVDTLVHSSLPGRNHSGNSRRPNDGGCRDIDSHHPRGAVDYLGDSTAPQVGIGYLGVNDPARIGNCRLGDANRHTKAVQRPYSVVEDDHLVEDDRGDFTGAEVVRLSMLYSHCSTVCTREWQIGQ